MNKSDLYDITIIGAGMAGLQLVVRMAKDPYFDNSKILLLDKSEKKLNDHTWSFWEKGTSHWDEITKKTWRHAYFVDSKVKLKFDLHDINYKTIQALDFYKWAFKVIAKKHNITFLKTEVETCDLKEGFYQIRASTNTNFRSKYIFDSRLPESFITYGNSNNYIKQHFLGWNITFEENVLDEHAFVMMDYTFKHLGTTSFMYLLPYHKKSALFEATFFTSDLVEKVVYENMIRNYLHLNYPNKKYEINEKEYGVIPMTVFPFNKKNDQRKICIGTAGGWVRPSTGYAFKNTEKNVKKIVENLKSGRSLLTGTQSKRAFLFDKIYLEVLKNENDWMPIMFRKLYQNNPIDKILKFLDGETSFFEDLKIIWSLPKIPFTKALFRIIFK